MKVTININGVDVEIQLTPEQEALAIKQAKPKFEWKYGDYSTYVLADTYILKIDYGNNSKNLEHGRYRKTQKTAEQSLARNKRANRLEALAEQLGGLIEFDSISWNYHIYQEGRKWIGGSTSLFLPEVVYMTKDCAIEICRMLNAGEFSLAGELA